MSEPTTQAWVQQYRDALTRLDGSSLERDRGARSWNALVDDAQWAFLALRQTDAGRMAISAMMDDPIRTVSQAAAGHALEWDEAQARDVLERWVAQDVAGSFDCRIVLQEYSAGRLRLDWEPKRRRPRPLV